MQVLVVLAHPDPGSFNHAIAGAVCEVLREQGHRVWYHDLYAERFDPVLSKEEIPEGGPVPVDIQQYCEELQAAGGIVIVHPNWWGQPPAILKGWIDRALRPGVAYRFDEDDSGEGIPIGLLSARAAVVFNTSNTPEGREASVFGDPLEALWRRCIFELCGIHTMHRRTFSVVVTSSSEQRQAWLAEARELVAGVFGDKEAKR